MERRTAGGVRPLWRLVALLAAVAWRAGVASETVELADADFQRRVAEYELALVLFFAPWCGHCKALAPEYEIAASRLKGTAHLIKVDCTANFKTCSKHGVNSYPTLKVFRYGQESEEYKEQHTADDIVKYMWTRAEVTPAELKTSEDLNNFINNFDASIVGFFVKNSSHQEEFLRAADSLRTKYRFAYTNAPELLKKYSPEKEAVVLFRPPRFISKFEDSMVTLRKPISTDNIKEFIQDTFFGICPHMTPDNKEELGKRDILVAYYNVDFVRDPKGTNYWRNRLMMIAEKFLSEGRKLSFAVANHQDFADTLAMFGLDLDTVKLPVVTIETEKGEKYIMQQEFTADGKRLEGFLKDYFAGKLRPYTESEPVPEESDELVKEVFDDNFDQIVNDVTKDVLIAFYTPWCSTCEMLESKYNELAEKLAENPHIVVAKMDVTANEIPPLYNVTEYPTVYFVPKNKKQSPKKYEGDYEDTENFINFLKEVATFAPLFPTTSEDPDREEL
ncbi:protein disulfide-isomerase A3-like [Latimeria chalumnae]|uniref:Protein disulfide-isomerase A3 n=1 Tax=Latimeria chalumnae TaxID=7897 RepID=H3A1C6_LATCH|nr:PREDICTED: protein disulfide-isomerase A3-like [Latimeria chalumnae]|eukprot:XP_014351967.1 PREDICTED: protein disulfide-isomerase A3-like [Latimeria chalumnae]